ncbi:MAG TPA: hypothetical protein VK509_12255 [Polyangiales bacterium]|nr:hypothetical protein [Polyangiales bacterium]
MRNTQQAVATTPAVDQWVELARVPGTAANIAAGRRTVWVTNAAATTFQQTAKF